MASILIVDDDHQIRKLLVRLLEKEGNHVTVASNGDEAIKQYDKAHIDLVITDIVMPEKEGIETIMELKRLDPEIKIIAISGGGKVSPENYLGMAKSMGAIYTIEKPIDKNVLLDRVNAALDA